jgi:2-polyprenyl-3-methyl-5-hydroxy-6-metoxy-1,4-benzoquinol methylase
MTMTLVELRRLWGGFQASRVIVTANNFGVFDRLVKPRTAAELARAVRADKRAAEILLDALVAIGLVRKTKNRYRNAAVAARYLVKGTPHYQGYMLRHVENIWSSWAGLDKVLQTGRPARGDNFDHEAFIMGMHNLSVLRVKELVKAMGLGGVKSALDLGSGPGTNALAMAKKGIRTTIFDTPDTIKIAQKIARKEGVRGVRFIGGDFHVDDIGKGYDVILLSQILHSYTPEENIALLLKCRDVLNPRGRVFVHEFPLNEDRTSPPHGALFSINMLVATDGGRAYPAGEISGWLKNTGFVNIKVKPLKETVMIEGRLG